MVFSCIASAQQQPSANEQALGAKLWAEFNAGLACQVAVIDLQTKIKALEAKLAELAANPHQEEKK